MIDYIKRKGNRPTSNPERNRKMKAYQSTAAQARFADSLGEQLGDEAFEAAYEIAARINQNRPWTAGCETRIQATRRLSKKAASRLIDELIQIRDSKN